MIQYWSILKNYLVSKINKKPYKINLFVTDKCNSHCKNCFIWKKSKNILDQSRKELNLQEFEKIFYNLPNNIFWLAITGGEPYLRDDLYKIIVLARKNIQNLKIISIPSNGLDKERTLNIIKRLIKFRKIIFYLSFSIDGSEKVHNKIRGVKNAYTKTMETYEAVRLLVKPYKNFHIFLQTTISKYNSSDLYNYLDRRINKLKLQDDFVVTVFHEAPFYKNKGINNLNRVKMSDINRIIEIIKKSKKEFDPKNYIQKKYLKGLSSYIVNKENIIECMALQDSFSINNYGEMSPCLMWSMNLGNFREFGYNINKVWKSGNFNSIREKIKRHQCPGCWTPCEAYQSIISDTFFNSFIIKNILRFK